ncbi:serine (or cysteine) peptidase inhibitor clade B member 7 [Cricetulus griseus]
MASLAAANAEFGFDLFREMDSNQGNGNVFFSSLSIFTALTLIRLGARGDCARQIDKALYFNTPSRQGSSSNNQYEITFVLLCLIKPGLQHQLKSVLADINSSHKDYELSIANGLFAEKVFDFHKISLISLISLLPPSFTLSQPTLSPVPFTGKIKKVLGGSSLSSSAVMVLVNAVYFKGKWKSAFTKSDTLNCRFRSPTCSDKAVAMMHQERKFNLSTIQDPPMQVLELQYHGDISMYIMLPENDISQIENKLNFRNLMNWTSRRKMKSQYVDVFLPQFKIEKNYEMRHHLKSLGLQDIFDESRADLSGMASGGRLYVSKLMHKSFIEVTEEGTEATAATENNIVEKQLPESTVFRADHPFLFVIRKNANAEFGFDLFREMDRSQGNEIILFSPLTIITALATIRLGSRGDSAHQIDKYEMTLVSFCLIKPGLQQQLKSVLADINSSHKDYELSIANGLFAEKVFDFHKISLISLISLLPPSFTLSQPTLSPVPFTGKIKKVLGGSSLSSSAVMVLVNAVYFKGKWKSAFNKSETLNCRFRSPMCSDKTVAMMHQERKFNLSTIQDPPMQVLELQYHGGINMYIMLPENDISQIESKLNFRNLMNWTSRRKMKSHYVDVFLPQFKIEKNYEIRHHLKSLGLQDIFDECRADLSGMSSGGHLYVSKLMHKSFLDVTEEGTETTAATEDNIVEKQLPESRVFRADHPFLFVISKNDIILFTGKVSCP